MARVSAVREISLLQREELGHLQVPEIKKIYICQFMNAL